MKLKELEKHAQNIIGKLGGDNYDEMLRAVIKAIPNLDTSDETAQRYKTIQSLIQSHITKNSDTGNMDLMERLTVILMVIVAKKFQAIHKAKT